MRKGRPTLFPIWKGHILLSLPKTHTNDYDSKSTFFFSNCKSQSDNGLKDQLRGSQPTLFVFFLIKGQNFKNSEYILKVKLSTVF